MISNFYKNCERTTPGNFNKLFVAVIGDMSGLTLTGDLVTDIVMDGIKEFSQVNADIDSVIYTSSLEGKSRQFYGSELVARFTKKNEATIKLEKELSDGVVCGLVVIRVDNDKNIFISGVNENINFSRPYDKISSNFNSGSSVEDIEEGNSYTITLSKSSPESELMLSETLRDSILDGTATFINWGA